MENVKCIKCSESKVYSTLVNREKLLSTVNKVAEVLLTANEADTLTAIMSGMEIVGKCVDADRVQIWRNEMIDGELHFAMRYEWLSEVGKQKMEVPLGLRFPYRHLPEWYEMFMQRIPINSPVSLLSERDAAFLGYYEMVSIVCLPLFLNQEFIGFFSVDDCRNKKTYSKDEMDMFHSVGLMFTTLFNRASLTQERIAAERKHQAMELTQKLIDNAPVFIEYWDAENNLLDCNKKMMDALGVPSKAVFAKRFFDFSMPIQPCGKTAKDLNDEMIKIAVKKGKSRSEWVFKLPNGEALPSEATWVHVAHQGGAMIIVYSLDSRPIKAAIESDESNKAKSRFLARMSHEIRTPISAVLGISEMQLRNQDMPAQTEEAFLKIYESSRLLLNIVNDILDFSKVESGKMYLINNEYELAAIVSDIGQMHTIYAGQKDIVLHTHIAENLPAKMIGDALRIRQIIGNLLTNAFKYTEEGEIYFSLQCTYQKEDFVLLEISIKDTGLGMTEAQKQSLNDEYVRLHEQEKPFVSGTGLGIPIVRSLTRMMNAEFDLQSEAGKGTHVTVKIPQEVVGTEVIGPEMAQSLEKHELFVGMTAKDLEFIPTQMPQGRVLVVDDIDMNLYVAEAMLDSFGLTVELCECGQQVIEKIKQGLVYDVIFLDYMMPEMDGIEVVKILREMGYKKPIVALTANAIKGQDEMFMKNGFSGFMTKPIDIKVLNTYLERFVRDK